MATTINSTIVYTSNQGLLQIERHNKVKNMTNTNYLPMCISLSSQRVQRYLQIELTLW